jgi:hypothetical protein
MRLGILGLPLAGKTTVFNALTGAAIPVGPAGSGGIVEVHERIAPIRDPRLQALADLLRPRKVTHAQAAFVDVDGLHVEVQGKGLPGALVDHVAKVDGLVAVVRAFPAEEVSHPMGRIDPEDDLRRLEEELLLNDQLAVERRLERLAEERQKGARDRSVLDREKDLFARLQQELAQGRPLRRAHLTAEEEHALAGHVLLTRKPMLAVVNHGDETPGDLPASTSDARVVGISGRLEMEIAQLPSEEAPAFLTAYGLPEPGRERVLRECIALLGLQTFFTVNEQEGKAWMMPRGATALDAAGLVHTDLARGFVRAEVIPGEQLVSVGGLPQARARGLLRLVGKEAPVADGDFVLIRSSV